MKDLQGSSYGSLVAIRHDGTAISQHYPILDPQGQWPSAPNTPTYALGRYFSHPHPPTECTPHHWIIGAYQAPYYLVTQKVGDIVCHDRVLAADITAVIEPFYD
ncbi:hypothetical protein EBZ35_08720 [bacterium]|nr:hypothetical protein [bacterium]